MQNRFLILHYFVRHVQRFTLCGKVGSFGIFGNNNSKLWCTLRLTDSQLIFLISCLRMLWILSSLKQKQLYPFCVISRVFLSLTIMLWYQEEHKKSSVKTFVTGKIIRHFLPRNFFIWISENINCMKKY